MWSMFYRKSDHFEFNLAFPLALKIESIDNVYYRVDITILLFNVSMLFRRTY